MNNKAIILDIAMNLNRIGNFAADNFEKKQNRIQMFFQETSDYIQSVQHEHLPYSFKKTFFKFLKEYEKLKKELEENPKDKLVWAETMMTWGNILTHRSKLIDQQN